MTWVDRFKLGPDGLWITRTGKAVGSTDPADYLVMDDREVNQLYMSGTVAMISAALATSGPYRDAEVSVFAGGALQATIDAYDAYAVARLVGYKSGISPQSSPPTTPVRFFSNDEVIMVNGDSDPGLMPYVARVYHGLGYTPIAKVDNAEFTKNFYQGSNIRTGRGTYYSWVDHEYLWILNGFYVPNSGNWYSGIYPDIHFTPATVANVRYRIYKEPVLPR